MILDCHHGLSIKILMFLTFSNALVLLLNAVFVVKLDLQMHPMKREIVREIVRNVPCDANNINNQDGIGMKTEVIPHVNVRYLEEARDTGNPLDLPLCDNETKVTECEIPFSQFQYPANVNLTQLVQTIKLTGKAPIGVINTYKHTPILSPSLPCGRSGGKSRRKTEILFLIKSSPVNFARRKAIRETWGNEEEFPDIRRVFVMGFSLKGSVQSALRIESGRYGDILQYDFIDTYYNLTLKAIGCMNWSGSKCKNDVHYVIMADDDYYLATDFLLEYLSNLRKYNITRIYMGGLINNPKPQRERQAKWYISLADYPYSSYPPVVRGGTLVLSIDLMHDMSLAAPFTNMMPFDDVYMAIIAYKLGVSPMTDDRFSFKTVLPKNDNFRSVFSSHGYRRAYELKRAWKCHLIFQKIDGNATQFGCS